MKGILGKKVGMTQVFTKDGKLIPVTVIEVEPNVVTQIKTVEKDGYDDICAGAERTFDLKNDPNRTIAPGYKVRLKAIVVGGSDKLAEESFIYDPNSSKTARYKITGSLFGKTLHFEDCN